VWHWGAAGAAAGTTLAQYTALIPLLYALHCRHVPLNNMFQQVLHLKQSLKQYILAGGLVLLRTVAKVLAYSITARQAALLGSVAAATYNLTFQLGFATTQICEAVAVAVQTLLAREMAAMAAIVTTNANTAEAVSSTAATAKATAPLLSKEETDAAAATKQSTIDNDHNMHAALIRHLINTSVLWGGVVVTILSLLTWWGRDWILPTLMTNVAIQQVAATIFPAILLTQILKGLAYPVNGILMGGLDWWYSMITMWIANGACVAVLKWFGGRGAGGSVVTLGQIWWALAAFMGTQVVLGVVRYQSRTGVWRLLHPRIHQKSSLSSSSSDSTTASSSP